MKTNIQFLIISRPVLLRMRSVSDKIVEKIKAHILGPIIFRKNNAYYEINGKNIVEPNRPRMTIQRMRIACWIPKATKAHSEYVILIALPQQQWLKERASVLRYTYTACLVYR